MATEFIKISSAAPVADYLTATLTRHLKAGEHVLWLIPGGSALAIAADVSRQLTADPDITPEALSRLAVTLTDERYGAIGHADSNWRALEEAGFNLPGATLLPVLTGADLPGTVAEYAAILTNHLHAAEFSLGFFGIGADGHTAGILPHSPAVAATHLAAGYNAATLGPSVPPFMRVTMTAPAIKLLHEAVVYAVGESKRPVLKALREHRDFIEQPAQALKTARKLTIFNDQIGDSK